MGRSDDRRLGMGMPVRESLRTLDCPYSSEIFFSNLFIPPWEAGAIKDKWLVHDKDAKNTVEDFSR